MNSIEIRIDNLDLAPEVAKEVARVAGNRYAGAAMAGDEPRALLTRWKWSAR